MHSPDSAPRSKERLKTLSEEAVGRGIFGSPFILVDGEPFRGWDRLPMVERWLARGGWWHASLASVRRDDGVVTDTGAPEALPKQTA